MPDDRAPASPDRGQRRRPRRGLDEQAGPTRRVRPAPRAQAPRTPGSTQASPHLDAAQLARHFIERALAAWQLASPHLLRAGRVLQRALAWLLGRLVHYRLLVFRASHRVLWWGALAAMFLAGRALLSGHEVGPVVDQAHLYFAAGLGACLLVLVFAAERRMRLAAFMLGAGHGAFGLVTWLITQA